MKSTFIGLLAAAAFGGLIGCSKAYDSDPDTNLSTSNNPVAPVTTAGSGQIICRVGKLTQKFNNAFWVDALGADQKQITGINQLGNNFNVLTLILNNSAGIATPHTYGNDSAGAQFLVRRVSDSALLSGAATYPLRGKRGYAVITLTDNANNILVGSFNFKAYISDTAGRTVDSVVATEGTFNVPKLQL